VTTSPVAGSAVCAAHVTVGGEWPRGRSARRGSLPASAGAVWRRRDVRDGARGGGDPPDVVFFESRRRHTRLVSDWSSDVCSSDLPGRQQAADTDTLARGLLAAGIATGERVGIWSPNCPEWVLLQYATAKMGAILVNINPAYRTHELAYVLRQAGIKLLVSAESFRTSDYRAMVGEVRGDLPGLEDVIFIGTEGWDKLLAAGVAAADAAAAGDEPDALAAREATLAFDDPINIQYTSGTTGFPKGATLSHHNILNNGFFIGEYCRYTEADR